MNWLDEISKKKIKNNNNKRKYSINLFTSILLALKFVKLNYLSN